MGPRSDIRYTLNRSPAPSQEEAEAYQKMSATMNEAVKYYKYYSTGLTKIQHVSYNAHVRTADGLPRSSPAAACAEARAR